MLFFKLTSVITILVGLSAANRITDTDYLNAAAKRNGGMSADQLRTTLTQNGQKTKIDAALKKAQDDGKVGASAVCDLTCPDCATCSHDLTNLSIELAATWATCALACVTIVSCPGAIGLASITTATLCSQFCNDHGQGVTCTLDCNWAVCKGGVGAPGGVSSLLPAPPASTLSTVTLRRA